MPTPAQPNLGYGNASAATLDQVNIWMRSTPWYQALLRSWGQDPNHVHLNDGQKQQIVRAAQANGVVVDEGKQEIDDSGNFRNQGHALRNTLIVAGLAAATIATMGAAGVFAGAGGAAASGGGAAGAGAAAAGSGAAAAGAGGTLASTAIGSGYIPAIAGGTGLAGATTAGGYLAGILPSIVTSGAGLGGTIYAAHKAGEAADAQAAATRDAIAAQTQANDTALAFQKQQAENAFRQGEADRHATYDQWAAREGRISTAGQWLGLPARDIPAYVPGIDPQFTGPTQPGAGAPPSPGASLAGMPAGIDPRLAAEYTKYHITPGAPGSGLSDWQYWQNDALRNAKGDWGYVLGRLDSDFAGTGPDARGAGAPPMAPPPSSAGGYLAGAYPPQSTAAIAPALPMPMYRYSPGAYFR